MISSTSFRLEGERAELVDSLEMAVGKVSELVKSQILHSLILFSKQTILIMGGAVISNDTSFASHPLRIHPSQVFSLERRAKEQEREAKLGERELGELRSSNQYLLERLEQVLMLCLFKPLFCFLFDADFSIFC